MGKPEPTGESPFKRFESLARRLAAVPKAEIQAAEVKRKARRKRPRARKPT